jgi:2,3-bisphosphoglycerate-independent phosphoglycerate mutase
MKGVILIVLDGYGIAPPGPGNAIYLANPTNINSFVSSYPNTTLRASGQSVGLPAEEVGNTEVGHINLGAGRIVFQDLPRINMSIADGSFYKNPSFLKIKSHLDETNGKLHIIGLVGEGSVHSSIEHLYALLFFAKEIGLQKVYVHAITDGRDSPPKSAKEIIQQLEEKLSQTKTGIIASIMGRYYGMDRDRRWERTEKAYIALTKGEGLSATSAQDAITNAYNEGKTDEFIEPTLITYENKPISLISEGDAVVFFNYRIDRPRQLTKAFVLEHFEEDANKSFSFDPYAVKYHKTHFPTEIIVYPPFKRGPKLENLLFITMTEYEKNLPVEVAYPPVTVQFPLGKVLSDKGINQLRVAESEKERFVTFYFNGQRETPFPIEQRLIVPSPKVPTYDLKPEMAANEITDQLLINMRSMKYPFILVNFANADMVGHTGNIEATIVAIKTIDQCITRIVHQALPLDYSIIITADHGNAEQKINPQTGEISTEHTSNPVPFIVISNKFQGRSTKLPSGMLADVAPTVLTLLDIPKPQTMSGRNLLEELKF